MLRAALILAPFVLAAVLPFPAEAVPPGPGALAPEDIGDFDAFPEPARNVIRRALDLARGRLAYLYGSADPAKGGMDCSGTIYFLLMTGGFKDVPRQADDIYQWVWQNGRFHAVNGTRPDGFEFSRLQPGDLLFWSGTYEVKRDPPVTHVMLYLGRRKMDGKRVMFGASEGRRYDGVARSGVGVFDFVLPPPGGPARFLGYGAIPGLTAAAAEEPASGSPPPQNTEAAPPEAGSTRPPADRSQSVR